MENYYIYLIAGAVILFIGFWLGVKTMFFLSRLFGNNGNGHRRRNHWDNDYNDYDNYDQKGQGGNFFFGFIIFLVIGLILAVAFKSEISKMKLGNIMGTGLLKTEKKLEAIPVPNPTQHETPDEIPKTTPALVPKGPQTAPKPTAAEGKYIVQLGAFGSEEKAMHKIVKLQNKGIRVQYVTKRIDGNERYVVFAGPYNTLEDAEAVQKELNDKQGLIRHITL